MGRASRKRKHQTQKSKTPKSAGTRVWGFDYGITPHVAVFASVDFNQKLRDAEIIGASYGIAFSSALGQDVPHFSLVGRNEAPLRQAFEEFARWAKPTDADAIDLTLVFRKDGGYNVIIGPELKALAQRTLGFDAVLTPLTFGVSWVKPIDTTSVPLIQLRTHLEKGMRPFLFSATIYTGLAAGRSPVPELIRPIDGLPELLKFQLRFVDEGAQKDKEWEKLALVKKGARKERLEDARPALPPKGLLYRLRLNRLRELFPVTIWRMRQVAAIQDHINNAAQLGLRPWQIQQALCNLVLSREITNGQSHFRAISVKEWPGLLIQKLQNRFELADGNTLPLAPIAFEEIVCQAILDGSFLLKTYNQKTREKDLVSIQQALALAALLDECPV